MIFHKNSKKLFAIASFLMALTIAIGAFGAHGLKNIVNSEMLKIYHTGVEYSFYNILGLFCIAILINFKPQSKKLYFSSYLVLIGTLLFSFSLYGLVLFKIPILGIITPIGGTLLIIAWFLISYSIFKD